MSIELVGLVVAIVGSGLAAIQVWQGRRRSYDKEFSAAGQALREEAAEALTEAAFHLDFVVGLVFDGGGSRQSIEWTMEDVTTLCKELFKIQSRLNMTRGVSENETTAFGRVVEASLSIAWALHSLWERALANTDTDSRIRVSRADVAAIHRGLREFTLAQAKFEKAVSKARAR